MVFLILLAALPLFENVQLSFPEPPKMSAMKAVERERAVTESDIILNQPNAYLFTSG